MTSAGVGGTGGPTEARRVTVIGGGVGGTAAAYAAKSAGLRVSMVVGRPGATLLTSGALDGELGDDADRAAIAAFLQALGIWELAGEPCQVATLAGILRPSRGRDVGVLDLGRVEPGVVGVIRAARAGWDADAVARAWSSEPWAVTRGVRFEPLDVDVLQRADDAVIGDSDLARRHDSAERAGWLAEQLCSADSLRKTVGVLLGPWLGIRRSLARELSLALGKPVGEPLSLPGGVAGLRFEHARDSFLEQQGIDRIAGQVNAVHRDEQRQIVMVDLDQERSIETDEVVLATGGLVGGGLTWSSAGFGLAVDAPVMLAIGRQAATVSSGSPCGPLFESYAWSGTALETGMEQVGIWTAPDGSARNAEGELVSWIKCAGDAVAGAPRTLVQAIRSGLVAGRSASDSTLADFKRL